jgi:hypothetical protein
MTTNTNMHNLTTLIKRYFSSETLMSLAGISYHGEINRSADIEADWDIPQA